jgi:DNA (cytosine-5)-methyltransferase 1
MEHPKTGDHPVNVPPSVEHRTKTRAELVALCKARGIRGYSGKPIVELVRRLSGEDDVLRGNRGIPSAQSGSLAHDDAMTAAHDDAMTAAHDDAMTAAHDDAMTAAHDETTTVATAPPSSGVGALQMIDLFAGTGAFTLAFQSTNAVNVVFGNDMVESSKAIYDANFAHPMTLQNLHDVAVEAIPPHDILTGGFPCQPFSIAGLREGFNDARSNVFWKIVSIIDHHHPRCVVLENVKNLVGHDEGRTFQTIKGALEERGYHVCYKVLNTATITGIPQHRERTYMVCLKSRLAFEQFNLEFPTVAKRPIAEFLEADVHPKYYYTEKSSTWELVRANVVKPDTIYQYRRVYVRENKSRECPTLTANMGAGGHNVPLILDAKGIRKLTPRECFNLQGFPQSYRLPALSDSSLYKLAGNAVSVPVVALIAARLIPLLRAASSCPR